MNIKFTIVVVLVIVAAAVGSSLVIQNALAKQGDSGSYDAGFKHGCSDAKLPINDRYINIPGKGAIFHSQTFMDGYTQGFEACKIQSDGTASATGSSSSSTSGGSASSSSSSSGPIIINNLR